MSYIPGDATNTLTELVNNDDYWILMNEPGRLKVEGPIALDNLVLEGGVNVIGLPGFRRCNLVELMRNNPGLERIWSYNINGSDWHMRDLSSPAFLQSLQHTMAGCGYFVVVNTATTINLQGHLDHT
jgi:hypothetical protein